MVSYVGMKKSYFAKRRWALKNTGQKVNKQGDPNVMGLLVSTRAGEIPKKFITPSQNEVYI